MANSEPGPPPSSLHELPPALRQLFMQTMPRECGGGVGDAVRTRQSPQSVPTAHIGISELMRLPSSQSLQLLSEENTLLSKQKKDGGGGGGGEVAPSKGRRLPRRDNFLSPSKDVEVALSAHVPMETARSGKRSGKPSIAAVRMVVEGRDHVRTRRGLNLGDGAISKRSRDATDEVTCSCNGCV